MLILKLDEVKQVLSMNEAIEINEQAYVSYSTGQAQVPLRYNMQLDHPEDFTLFMPGYLADIQGLGMKVVTILPENVKNNLPATQGVILLCDRENGLPSALMDGTFITALRTGAGTGVATKYLAREDSSSLAIIGTGGMAPGQLEAICCVRDIKEVYIYNRTKEKAEAFAEEMKRSYRDDLTYIIKETPEAAVREADIVVTTTASPEPVVKYSWLKKGTHVNAIGGFNSNIQEVDEELILKSEIRTVDGISATSVAGDLAIPLNKKLITESDLIEIGSLIHSGTPGRTSPDSITFFKSVGLSVQDIAVAVYVLRKAEKEGLGTKVSLY